MSKWIGRVLYILFVLSIVVFIELGFGGANGIRNGEYISKYALGAYNEDGSYNYQEAILRYNAALGIYYSDSSIKNKDGEELYSNASQVTDTKYQLSFGVYPLISTQKDKNVNIWYDGFYIILDNYSTDINYYSFEITAVNLLDPTKEIVLKQNLEENDGKEFNIYTKVDQFALNLRIPMTTYIYNPQFFTDDQENLTGLFEYDIKSINVFAYEKDLTKDPVHIYEITDGTNDTVTAATPLATDDNLNLTAETFNISKLLVDAKNPTEAEIQEYNILTNYHPVDFSEFNYVYLYIIPIYLLLLLVIPYFWFFHKKLMIKLGFNKKKSVKVETKDSVETQLFEDHTEIEEKAKKKK